MKKKENASFDSEILQLDSVDTADTTQLPIEHLIGFVKKREDSWVLLPKVGGKKSAEIV